MDLIFLWSHLSSCPQTQGHCVLEEMQFTEGQFKDKGDLQMTYVCIYTYQTHMDQALQGS